MTQLLLSVPQTGQPNATEDPKIATSLNAIQSWANGNIDGANVPASLTGRRLIASAAAFVGPGVTVGNYFVAADGTLISSSSTKAVMWWDLDPANFSVAGKSNTQMVLRMSLAAGVTPAASVSGQLNAVTFSGSAGAILAALGGVQATSLVSSPAGSSVNVAESGAVTFPSAGAYAPVLNISGGTTAANSAMSVLWQLFVLNS